MSPSIPPLAEVTTTKTAAKTTTTITVKANNETKKHRNRQTTFTWNPCVVNTKNPRKRNPPNQNQGRSYHFFEAGKSPIFTYQTLRLSRVFPSAFHPSNSTCNLAKPKKNMSQAAVFPKFSELLFWFPMSLFVREEKPPSKKVTAHF